MASYLVTGSSRGLGLALVECLASLPKAEVRAIFATARQGNSLRLKEIMATTAGRVEFIQLDVTDEKSIKDAAATVENKLNGGGLDCLINNAGMKDWTPAGLEEMENLTELFNTNVAATHLVTRAFLPLLRRSDKKVVINLSSTLGSITKAEDYHLVPSPAYKITKAALNMLTVQYAQQYRNDGFTFMAVNPGWLRTDMGGSDADLPVETGADRVMDIAQNACPEQNGKFYNIYLPDWEDTEGFYQYDGKEICW